MKDDDHPKAEVEAHIIEIKREGNILDYIPERIISVYKSGGLGALEKMGMPDHIIIQALKRHVFQESWLPREGAQERVSGCLAKELYKGGWPLERVVEAVMKNGGNRGSMEMLVGEFVYLRKEYEEQISMQGPLAVGQVRQMGKDAIRYAQ